MTHVHASFVLTDPEEQPWLSSERMYRRIFESQKPDLRFLAWCYLCVALQLKFQPQNNYLLYISYFNFSRKMA